MALARSLVCSVACAVFAEAQFNTLGPHPRSGVGHTLPKSLTSLPPNCPDQLPDASVSLPTPLPPALTEAIDELQKLLAVTVSAVYPAPTAQPLAAVLHIEYRGQPLLTAAAGDADPKAKSGPPGASTIFRIGSVTKIFPVLMLYQLFDQGFVASLDDPLSKYAPHFDVPSLHSRSVRRYTLRQLASQLSGLPRECPCSMHDCHLTSEEVFARLKATPGAIFAENAEPSYSNLAYALLGNALADYMNTTFAGYVTEHILEPLGMHDSGFLFDAAVEARMAKAYSNDTRTANTDIGYVGPAGQMYSTAADMMKLGRFLLGLEGHLFDDGLRTELLLPTYVWRDGAYMQGAPWEAQLLDGNWLMLGKGGNVWGYSAAFAVVPQLNLSLTAMWSGAVDETSFMSEAFKRLLPSFVPALSSQRTAPTQPKTPERYVGRYTGNVFTPDAPAGGIPITYEITQAPLSQGGSGLQMSGMGMAGFLDFRGEELAAFSLNGAPGVASCFGMMASGMIDDWAVFERDAAGEVHALTKPGQLYGVRFVKQQGQQSTIFL